MAIELKKSAYEKLIKQLIFIEENKEDLEGLLINNGLFDSRSDIQKYFRYYMKKVESILTHAVTIDDCEDFSMNRNILPFIVLDSCFTLKDKNGKNYYCYLTSDIYEKAPGIFHNIYAFSESGLDLLMKEKTDLCFVDLGNGFKEYVINSIKMS